MTQPIDNPYGNVSDLTNDVGYKVTKTLRARLGGGAGAGQARAEQIVFIADTNYTITRIDYIATSASATPSSTVNVTRDSGTEPMGTGDVIATAALDGTANTIQNLSLSNTALVEGDRISVATPSVIDYGDAVITITLE